MLRGWAALLREKNRPPVRDLSGKIAIVSYLQGELRVVHVTEDAKDDITSLVFSPDGARLYGASLDCNIYIYDAFDNFKYISTMFGHSEGIKSLDITEDGKYLVSMGVKGEVIMWNAVSNEMVPVINRPKLLASATWNTRQGVLGLDMVGAFPAFGQMEDLTSVSLSKSASILAVADRFGFVDLVRYPAMPSNCPRRRYSGHTPGGVTRVAFSLEDKYVISIGQDDRVIIQWRVVPSSAQRIAALPAPRVPPPPKLLPTHISPKLGGFDASFVIREVDFVKGKAFANNHNMSLDLTAIVSVGNRAVSCDTPSFLCSSYCGVGDILTCFGKVAYLLVEDHLTQRPWIPAPTSTYSCSTNSLLPTVQEIASVAVSSCARYVLVGGAGGELEDGVLGIFAASTGELLIQLASDIVGGVAAVAFSPGKLHCCAIGKDPMHSLYVYGTVDASLDWSDAVLLASTQVSLHATTLVTFLTKETALSSTFDIMTAGEGAPKFWKVKGRNLIGVSGQLPVEASFSISASTVVASLPLPQHVVTGDVDGNLWLWKDGYCSSQPFGRHSSSITALTSFCTPASRGGQPYGVISAGLLDGIKMWDVATMTLMKEYSVISLLSAVQRADHLAPSELSDGNEIRSLIVGKTAPGYVTSLCVDNAFRRILVTMSCGVVLEMAHDSGAAVVLAEGSAARVTAIVAHPSEPNILVTAGSDQLVRVWDVTSTSERNRGVISVFACPHAITALAFENESVLAIGTLGGDADGNSGSIILVNFPPGPADTNLELPRGGMPAGRPFTVLHKLHNVGKGSITMLRFGLPVPGYDSGPVRLAACSEDGAVYLFDIAGKTYTALGSVLVDSSRYPVAGVDFSVSGKYMRTFSRPGDYSVAVDVKYFDFDVSVESGIGGGRTVIAGEVHTEKQLEELRETLFVSVASPAAPEARALMKQSGPTPAPFSISSNPLPPYQSGQMIAAGYCDGTLAVCRSPAPSIGIEPVTGLNTHLDSSPMLVTFMAGGAMLCSVGADDGSIILWEVKSQTV